jgi:hypothetical protein
VTRGMEVQARHDTRSTLEHGGTGDPPFANYAQDISPVSRS